MPARSCRYRKRTGSTDYAGLNQIKMAMEDWQLCVEWLVRCQVLPSDHKLAKNDAQVFDLAQFIRDGVVLCHVLNHLSPGCINPKDFSQRPQMSQVAY